jgi:hypothetical protein
MGTWLVESWSLCLWILELDNSIFIRFIAFYLVRSWKRMAFPVSVSDSTVRKPKSNSVPCGNLRIWNGTGKTYA